MSHNFCWLVLLKILLGDNLNLLALVYALGDKEVHNRRRYLSTLRNPLFNKLWFKRRFLGLWVIGTNEVNILPCLWAGSFLKHCNTKSRVVLSANALETDHQHSGATVPEWPKWVK